MARRDQAQRCRCGICLRRSRDRSRCCRHQCRCRGHDRCSADRRKAALLRKWWKCGRRSTSWAEFVGRFRLERRPLPAIALADNMAALSAIGNDYSYEDVFVRGVRAFGETGDVLVGMSTSGTSRNVVAALEVAADAGLVTVALVGERECPMTKIADCSVAIPNSETARVQEGHMLVGHTIVEPLRGNSAADAQIPRCGLPRQGRDDQREGSNGGYVEAPEELRLLPGVARAIRILNDAGVRVLVITNQRGIARGRLTVDRLGEIHTRLGDLIAHEADAHIDGFFFCPHEIGTCECRKPKVGMFLQAKERWPEIDVSASAMVGDSLIDVEAGQAMGMTTLRLGVDVPDLAAAVICLVGDAALKDLGPVDRAREKP